MNWFLYDRDLPQERVKGLLKYDFFPKYATLVSCKDVTSKDESLELVSLPHFLHDF